MNTQHGTFRVSIRVVRPCPVKLIIWSTNPSQREKEQMLLSVICMIFFKIMVRARKLVIFMQTTVAARIRTIMYSGTFAGGSFTDFTNMLPTLSSLQDTGNLAPIGVLGFWNRKFVEHYLVSSLFDIVEAMHKSTLTGVNYGKLVGLHNGTVLVKTYDWASHLGRYFRKINGVSKFHHFCFSKRSSWKSFLPWISRLSWERIWIVKEPKWSSAKCFTSPGCT